MSNERHSFSIEMFSIKHVNKVSLSNESNGEVLFEGELGGLLDIKLIEGVLLQITGVDGIFRIDLTEKELSDGLVKK